MESVRREIRAMKNIVVIGAGNIGTRHLQAITLLTSPINLFAVEPNMEAREKSKRVVLESLKTDIHKISYVDNINQLPSNIDLAVIAVNSFSRREVIEYLLEHSSVKYMILEKVLFPRIEDYHAVQKLLEEKNVTAWVNCVRRAWPFFKDFKAKYGVMHNCKLKLSGNMWGIGCNTIHYIDLLSYLTDCTESPKLDISMLDKQIIESKRSGYVEFTGTLLGALGNNSFSLESSAGTFDGFNLSLVSDEISCDIVEKGSQGIAKIVDYSTDSSVLIEEKYDVIFQSMLTKIIAEQIFETGKCDLIDYNTSMKFHIPMIQAFLLKINNGTDVCNIT